MLCCIRNKELKYGVHNIFFSYPLTHRQLYPLQPYERITCGSLKYVYLKYIV